jgi:pyridoxine 5'-phosphate synthase PdxJ
MEKLSDEEEKEEVIQEGIIEFTSSHEYIASACNSLNTLSDIDVALMSKIDEMRIKRIKKKCLRIIDLCIGEMYDELFESDDEE